MNDHLLMWSHYANHHKGICVGVRPEVIRKLFLEVQYVEEVPVMSVWSYVGKNRRPFVIRSISKYSLWSYEKEWRTIGKAGPRCFPGCVDTVIIGARAAPETRAAVHQAIADSGQPISVMEARLSDRVYRLEIVPEGALARDSTPKPKQTQKLKKSIVAAGRPAAPESGNFGNKSGRTRPN